MSELDLYESLAARDLAGRAGVIRAAYKHLHTRVAAAWMWASVYDQATFVLDRYLLVQKRSAERKAVSMLLDILGGFAGRTWTVARVIRVERS